MTDSNEDLTTAYMLGKHDGRKEAEAANSRCPASAGSDFKHLLISKIKEDCAAFDPLSEVQFSSIAGTISGLFQVVEIFGEAETVKRLNSQNNKDEHA